MINKEDQAYWTTTYLSIGKPGNSEVTYANLPFILLVIPIQHLLIVTYDRPEKRGGLCTLPYSWHPLGPGLTFWP